MKKSQWKTLTDSLLQQNCVLVLGAYTAKLPFEGKEMPLPQIFSAHLEGVIEELIAEEEIQVALDPKHIQQLPYVAQQLMNEGFTISELGNFVKECYDKYSKHIPAIYDLLAQLPFSIVLNMSPDDFMFRAFQKHNKIQAREAYYHFRNPRIAFPVNYTPSVQAPLVYNLCGSIKDLNSMVVSEDDQVKFMRNMLQGNPPIHNEILSYLDGSKTYLFTEMNLEHWHFRLLFDSLKLQGNDVQGYNKPFSPKELGFELSGATKSYFEKAYNFQFVEEDVLTFSQNLATEFDKVKSPISPQSPKNIFMAYVDDDKDFAKSQTEHLAFLTQTGGVTLNSVGNIAPGMDFQNTIMQYVESADLIIFLVSVKLLNSDLLSDPAILKALDRYHQGLAKVVLVKTRPCNLPPDLASYPILPQGNLSIEEWQSQDAAWTSVSDGLKGVLGM